MPSEQPEIITSESKSRQYKLLAAYHVAEGASKTASDHQQRFAVKDPELSNEFGWLSANFQRICELLKEAGVKL